MTAATATGIPPPRTTTFEAAVVGMAVLDADGRITSANCALGALAATSPAALLGLSLLELLAPDAETLACAARLELALADGGPAEVVGGWSIRLGRAAWARIHLTPIAAPGGTAETLVQVEDLTEQRRARSYLAAQHSVSQILASAMTLHDASPSILSGVCRSLGWSWGALWEVEPWGSLRCVDSWRRPELIGSSFEVATSGMTLEQGAGLPGEVVSERTPKWVTNAAEDDDFLRSSAASRTGLHAGCAFPIAAGHQVLGVMEFFGEEVRDPDPELLELFVDIGSQIGQFIRHTDARRDAEITSARLSAIVQSAIDSIVVMDQLGRIVEFGPVAERTFGYSRTEAVGAQMADLLVPPALREAHFRGLAHYLESGVTTILGTHVETTAMRAGGRGVPRRAHRHQGRRAGTGVVHRLHPRSDLATHGQN